MNQNTFIIDDSEVKLKCSDGADTFLRFFLDIRGNLFLFVDYLTKKGHWYSLSKIDGISKIDFTSRQNLFDRLNIEALEIMYQNLIINDVNELEVDRINSIEELKRYFIELND